jgi:sugar phosphate permease
VGATLSTTAAGYLADRYGMSTAFLGLAGLAGCGFLMLLAALKETRPD